MSPVIPKTLEEHSTYLKHKEKLQQKTEQSHIHNLFDTESNFVYELNHLIHNIAKYYFMYYGYKLSDQRSIIIQQSNKVRASELSATLECCYYEASISDDNVSTLRCLSLQRAPIYEVSLGVTNTNTIELQKVISYRSDVNSNYILQDIHQLIQYLSDWNFEITVDSPSDLTEELKSVFK